MMEFVFYPVIAFGVISMVTRNIRTGMILLGFAWFGPVGWGYLQTNDDSLIYEIIFRSLLILAAVYAAKAVMNTQASNYRK
ncbi:hypothetical protein ACEUCV_15460 [Aeromonas veronii]